MRFWPVTTRSPRQGILLIVAATGLLTGCGQKGDLIRPGTESTPAVAETTPDDEGIEQQNEADDEQ